MTTEHDPQDLHALEEAEAETAEADRLKRQYEIEDFKWLMSDARGRRIVWRLLEKAGVFRSTFRLNTEMQFLEGMRNMGLMLIAEIHDLCPEKYHLMVKEHQAHVRRISKQRGN